VKIVNKKHGFPQLRLYVVKTNFLYFLIFPLLGKPAASPCRTYLDKHVKTPAVEGVVRRPIF